MQTCESSGLTAKTIPALHELVDGQINLSRIRTVALEDLLRRSPVELDFQMISETVKDQAVLVTGAGGSIGSELCRIISGLKPSVSKFSSSGPRTICSIFIGDLVESFPNLHIVPIIADVCDNAHGNHLLQHPPRWCSTQPRTNMCR